MEYMHSKSMCLSSLLSLSAKHTGPSEARSKLKSRGQAWDQQGRLFWVNKTYSPSCPQPRDHRAFRRMSLLIKRDMWTRWLLWRIYTWPGGCGCSQPVLCTSVSLLPSWSAKVKILFGFEHRLEDWPSCLWSCVSGVCAEGSPGPRGRRKSLPHKPSGRRERALPSWNQAVLRAWGSVKARVVVSLTPCCLLAPQ